MQRRKRKNFGVAVQFQMLPVVLPKCEAGEASCRLDANKLLKDFTLRSRTLHVRPTCFAIVTTSSATGGAVRLRVLLLLFFLVVIDASAQGFPGGMSGGRGGMRPPPPGGARPEMPPEHIRPSPMAALLDRLRPLRMDLLIREDQLSRWNAMQDALRAYVDLEKDGAERLVKLQSSSAPVAPLERIRALSDDLQVRADAMRKASDTLAAFAETLDERQRKTFDSRVGDAFAGGAPSL